MTYNWKKLMWVMSGCTVLLVGCGKGSDGSGSGSGTSASPGPSAAAKEDTTPVTLSIFMDTAAPDSFVQDSIVKPVQLKYPYITLNFVKKGNGAQAADLIAANTFPDLIYSSPPFLPALKDLGLLYDMNDLIKKNNFDVSLYDKAIVDQIKMIGDKGELYGLPFYINYTALFYNKDMFDKFGVSYPKDNMTWDQAIDLGKKLSRTDGGIEYQGISIAGTPDLASQLTLPLIDPKTFKSQLNSADGYKKVLQLVLDYNNSGAKNPKWDSKTQWTTLAMSAAWGDRAQTYVDMAKSGQVFNWDLVSEPVFSGSTGYARRVDSHDLLVSSTAKNKDAAFKVIAYLLSKEYQTKLSRAGYLTALTDKELQKDYAVDVPELKGKNLQGIFKVKAAPSYVFTQYDSKATAALNKYTDQAVKGQIDINTALRLADEEANVNIQAAIQAAKK